MRAETPRRKNEQEKNMGNNSFVPLGTQAGWGREDRSPDLRLLQPPSHRHFFKNSPQWRIGGVDSPAGYLLARSMGRQRGAYSCGAVAELHRLPEHPGDCRDQLRYSNQSSIHCMESISMPSTFINGMERKVKDRKTGRFGWQIVSMSNLALLIRQLNTVWVPHPFERLLREWVGRNDTIF